MKIEALPFHLRPIVFRSRDGDPVTSITQAKAHGDVRVQIAEGTKRCQQEMRGQVNRLVQARTMVVRYIEINP